MGSEEVMEELESLIDRWQFSGRAKSLHSSIIREILKDSSKPGVINFAGGLPAPELFPVEEIRSTCQAVLEKYGPDCLQYSLTTGIPPLRDLLARRVSQGGLEYKPESIQITAGSQQGLDIIGRVFLEPGSVVLTEEPTYVGAIQAFSFYNVRFVSVATDGDGMLPDELEAKIVKYKPTIIYLVPNFQNPSGITMSKARRKEVIKLAIKHDVPVIDDNPYRELRYLGEHVPSLKAMDREHVIQLGTFSKIISPGLRIGWIVAEPEVIRICELMKQACDLHTNTFAQYVVYEFAASGKLERHIEKLIESYSVRRNVMIEALRNSFEDGTTWTEPEGGLFLWVKLPTGVSASELLPKALAAGVAYVPGKYFYSQKPDDSTMRLNFCSATEEKIVEGIRRLAGVIKRVS
jgi:2-aminoadipate transaminase